MDREKTMTAEQFQAMIEALIEQGRVGGLTDEAIRDALEAAAEVIDEGIV
jgi:hypothetical protein